MATTGRGICKSYTLPWCFAAENPTDFAGVQPATPCFKQAKQPYTEAQALEKHLKG